MLIAAGGRRAPDQFPAQPRALCRGGQWRHAGRRACRAPAVPARLCRTRGADAGHLRQSCQIYLAADRAVRGAAGRIGARAGSRSSADRTPRCTPIFTPSAAADAQWGWEMAKLVVQVADGNYHELFTHLARTHLVIEAFAVATHRHLAQAHPLWALLVPHFEGTLFINDQAATSLIAAKRADRPYFRRHHRIEPGRGGRRPAGLRLLRQDAAGRSGRTRGRDRIDARRLSLSRRRAAGLERDPRMGAPICLALLCRR